MRCYNCGKPLQQNEIHREHIPAKNLFTGFPVEYKNNRITVDACYDCNQSFSGMDEDFRNFIGVTNKNPQAFQLVETTIRSINRAQSKLAKVIYDHRTHKALAMKYDKEMIKKTHIKNFKGLFYHNYGYPLTENYKVVPFFEERNHPIQVKKLIKYLQVNFKWKVSGHENVFRYNLQPFREGYQFDNGSDIVPNQDENFFLAILSYTKNHAALVLAQRQ